MNRITCPKCRKQIVFAELNYNGVIYCNYCGSKLKISIEIITEQPPIHTDYDVDDDILEKAILICKDAGGASVSILQRRLGIGYPRAARLIDVMEQRHIIGPFEGSKPRRILI